MLVIAFGTLDKLFKLYESQFYHLQIIDNNTQPKD